MTVGEKIRLFRQNRGLTQKQLGELCFPKIAESTIRRYEIGKLNPKFETLKKIAKALNIDIFDLVDEHITLNLKEGKGTIDNVRVIVTDINESIVLNYYRQLNDNGKKEAYKKIGELTLIEEYKHNSLNQMPSPIFVYTPPED